MSDHEGVLPAEVRAAVTGPDGTTTVQSFPMPEIGDEDALLAVEASGVCGTDVTLTRHRRLDAPTILGHHVVGRIVRIGDEAKRRWSVGAGDLVAVQEYLPCQTCRWCKLGEYRMCHRTDLRIGGRRVGTVGIDEAPSLWGGNAEYMYLSPEVVVHPISADVLPELAVWLLPLANAFDWTVESGGAGDGATVVVVGPGQHGLTCVVAAREVGASNVIVMGREEDEPRLELARALGAHQTIVDGTEDLRAVREMLGDQLADVVVNTSGAGPALTAKLVALTGKRGTIVEAGLTEGTIELDLGAVTARALRLMGTRGRSLTAVDRAMRSLQAPASDHPLRLVPTQRIGLSALDEMLGRPSASDRGVHTVVVPSLQETP